MRCNITILEKPKTQIIEIHIIKHNDFYFYSRYVDSESEIFGEIITRQRAQDLIAIYQADDQIEVRTKGEIAFELGTTTEFSFLAKWVVDDG